MKYVIKDQKSIDERAVKEGKAVSNDTKGGHYDHETTDTTGSSATVTLTSPSNVKLLGIINAVANSTTYVGGPFAVSPGFGGTIPDHWGIVVENKTGGSTSAGACSYQGIKLQNQ